MQTTLRINDEIFREAKAAAARRGVTLTRFIEEALEARIHGKGSGVSRDEAEERNRMMESLLHATAHFRIGAKPSREEMNAR